MLVFWMGIFSAVTATAPVSTAMFSRDSTIILVMHYEDATNIAPIKTRMYDVLPFMANIFKEMQTEGHIDPNYPRVVIVARQYSTNNGVVSHFPTKITSSEHVFLACNNPDMQPSQPFHLGKSFIIQTDFENLRFNNVLTFLTLLTESFDNKQALIINDETIIQSFQNTDLYKHYLHKEWTSKPPALHIENKRILQQLRHGQVYYSVTDKEQNVHYQLPHLEHPITPLSHWKMAKNHPHKAYWAMATSTKGILIDAHSGIPYTVDLSDGSNTQTNIHNVQFFYHQELSSIILVVYGPLGQVLSVFRFEPSNNQWEQCCNEIMPDTLNDAVYQWKWNHTMTNFNSTFELKTRRNTEVMVGRFL